MKAEEMTALVAKTNELREKLTVTKARYGCGAATYAELELAAKAFGLAFDAYRAAKDGKRRAPTAWQRLIR